MGGASRVVSWFGSRDETYCRRLRALAPRALVAPPVPDDDTPVWRHLLGTLAGWDLAIPERVEPLRAPPLPAGDAPADAAGRDSSCIPGAAATGSGGRSSASPR